MAPVPVVFFIRGLPGSGRAELAASLQKLDHRIAADDYFFDADGVYRYNSKQVPAAHMACQARLESLLAQRDPRRPLAVAVVNVFAQRRDLAVYLDIARAYGATTVVLDRYDGGFTDEALARRNAYGVPADKIAAFRSRWEAL